MRRVLVEPGARRPRVERRRPRQPRGDAGRSPRRLPGPARCAGSAGRAPTPSWLRRPGPVAGRFAGCPHRRSASRKGDRVAGFLPRVPNARRHARRLEVGAVYVPIFTGFGDDALAFRMRHSGARLLRDASRAPRPGATRSPHAASHRTHTIGGGAPPAPGDLDFHEAPLRRPAPRPPPPPCRRDDPAVLPTRRVRRARPRA